MTASNYYARRKQREREAFDADLIMSLVEGERRIQPRLGGRKVFRLIAPDLAEAGVKIGRDRFFGLLRANNALIEKKKRKPRTTNSRHSLPVCQNLIKDMTPNAPNQVWVGDITYIDTAEGWMYAALITDLYSHKIVGAHIGDSLETEGCVKALQQAVAEMPADASPIHHSDRGCQYCSHQYAEYAGLYGLTLSMTQEMHCYENPVAERVNGILKDEYDLDCTFNTKQQAKYAFRQAVHLYNYRRPHLSLDYGFPGMVHKEAA
jgi:transposase InsO family protein